MQDASCKSSKINLCGLSELGLASNTSSRSPLSAAAVAAAAAATSGANCEQTLVGQKYVRCGGGGGGGERGNAASRPTGHWDIVRVA